MNKIVYTEEENKKIRKWKRFFNVAFMVEESDFLLMANYSEQLIDKYKNEEDIFGFHIPIVIIRNIVNSGHKQLNVDEVLKFLEPRYKVAEPLLKAYHDIDAQADLMKLGIKEFNEFLNKK